MSQPTEARPPVSVTRILAVVVPVAIIAMIVYWNSSTWESAARQQLATNVYARMLTSNAAEGTSMKYADKDGDLVADSPDDPAQCITPEVLTFSFIAGDPNGVPEEGWKELLAALKAKTGHEVKYVSYETVNDQLTALQKGDLHVVGLNTGIVPLAVERDGFVPLCTFGHEDGSFGYTMELLVPADSPLKAPADIRGHKVTFTSPDSNSGCKALLVYLKNELKMQPDQDYQWGFSLGHEESIKGVAAKELEVAPVASDILARAIEQGKIEASAVRSIYKSERFPPATIGYAYNLSPELRTAISEALVGFDLKGTGLQGEFGAEVVKLVPVNYKDAWANARRVNQMIADARRGR